MSEGSEWAGWEAASAENWLLFAHLEGRIAAECVILASGCRGSSPKHLIQPYLLYEI